MFKPMEVINSFNKQIIEKKPKIFVVGDAMVDENYYVDANRVSPEFPVPIMRSSVSRPATSLPGGAANVCRQFRYTNKDVELFSFVDGYSASVFSSYGINLSGSVTIPKRIPIKRRFYQNDFALCRWDIEEENYGLFEEDKRTPQTKFHKELFESFSERVIKENPQVVVFSDYGKGVFADESLNWIDKNSEFLSIVDPKSGPIKKWKNCTVFKPNAKEAYDLSGEKNWKRQCDYFMYHLDCYAVVITNGKEGVYFKIGEEYFNYSSQNKKEAESVIGAGDCFVSFLAACLPLDLDLIDSVPFCYDAGAVYVQKKHNTPVSIHEIRTMKDPIEGKIIEKELFQKEDGTNYVFTNGCFDILHEGHVELLKRAKKAGDKLIVAVNSDESVKLLKGDKRPINKLDARMKLLASLQFVDYVIPFYEETPIELIKHIKPNILVKGSDYKDKIIVGSHLVEKVIIFENIPGVSTTSIVDKAEK